MLNKRQLTFKLTAELRRPDWDRMTTAVGGGFGGLGNIPRGSTRCLVVAGSDTAWVGTDGAGSIGLGVEGNKEILAADLGALFSADLPVSATFFLRRPLMEGLSSSPLQRLTRITDRCWTVDLSNISVNFLNLMTLS